jgi:hypothetical protein
MADINHVISLGIGSPAGIPEFLTLGLQISSIELLVLSASVEMRETAINTVSLRETASGEVALRQTASGEVEI